MTIHIPDGAQFIIKKLEDAGFEAYVVGGCVRDSLLGKMPHDWDICTSATPEQMKQALHECHIIETGIQHGTLTVVIEGVPYEVTTFRIDGVYTDGRHPDQVTFAPELDYDLMRRDFTINAMAYNQRKGLIDICNGRRDLEHHILRCVGNPDVRFHEDGLRILRCLRFSSVYGFPIDPMTGYSIHKKRWLLDRISRERVRDELCKLLLGENVLDILLNYYDVICQIIPELKDCVGFDQNNPYHQYTIYSHIAHAVSNYTGDDLSVKVALLLHDIGKPQCYTEDERGGHFHGHGVPSRDMAEAVLDRLRFDNKTKREVLDLVLYHDSVIEPTPRVVKRWMNKIGPDRFAQLMHVRMADIKAHAEGTQASRIKRCEELRSIMEEVLAEQSCFSMKDLAVNGNDMIRLGVSRGPCIGEVLRFLLESVINGDCENDHDALMELANAWWCGAKVLYGVQNGSDEHCLAK